MAKKTAGSTKKSVLNKKIVSAPSERPNWPALQPLVPSETLFLDTVLEDQIILIRKLFTSSLCQNYVKFLSGLPLTITPGQPKKGEALRVNGRFQIDDADFAERLWNETGLRQLVESSEKNWGGEVCSLNPRIRIYRYTKGQFFDQHCRLIFLRTVLTHSHVSVGRSITVSCIYIEGDLDQKWITSCHTRSIILQKQIYASLSLSFSTCY